LQAKACFVKASFGLLVDLVMQANNAGYEHIVKGVCTRKQGTVFVLTIMFLS